jgi:transposase
LHQRLTQRDALLEMRQQVRNQRHALLQQPVVVDSVRTRMEQLLAQLTDAITEVEDEIAQVLQQDATWAAAAAHLQTIPGIGALTAAWILVTS